jgi:glutamate-1-semialdehyde 2,1-aminomutase
MDPNGTWWLDCQMGLAAYILGYSDPLVNSYVTEQVKEGSIFSLSSTLEIEVAEILIELFPEFDKVRFAKNGSDVTSAAIRIARRHTGRDHLIGCGYHGFQDWSMSLVPEINGIPQCVRDLSQGQEEVNLRKVLNLLDAFPRRFAAVIVDTGGSGIPDLELLARVRERCQANQSLFIMDEVISGFRVGVRGVLGQSGIVPDLMCLGKAVANGYPLSVLMGPKRLLDLAEETGMSATYAGDCIALAAAKGTLEQLKNGSVNAAIEIRGSELMQIVRRLLANAALRDLFDLTGYPALAILAPKGNTPRGKAALRFLMNALAKHQIFWQGSFVLCRDFGEHELFTVTKALESAVRELTELTDSDQLMEFNASLTQKETAYLGDASTEAAI